MGVGASLAACLCFLVCLCLLCFEANMMMMMMICSLEGSRRTQHSTALHMHASKHHHTGSTINNSCHEMFNHLM